MNNGMIKYKNQHFKIVIILVILGLFAIVSGGYLFYNDAIKEEKRDDNIPNKTLLCSYSENSNETDSYMTSTVDIKFDKNDFIDSMKWDMIYNYDEELYEDMKKMYSDSDITSSYGGYKFKVEFDDDKKTMKLSVNQKHSEIPKEGQNEELPTKFEDLKKGFLDKGYTCNGENGTEIDETQNDNL